MSSLELDDCPEISCEAIAGAIMELAGAKLSTPGTSATSPDWRAELESENSSIEFEMTLMGDPPFWGGFGLTGLTTTAELVQIALHLKSRCGPVWVHDQECTMYRPEVFEAAFAG